MVERKNTPISQPIRCKTETNRDLVTRVFTRGRGSLIFFFTLSSHWLLVMPSSALIGCLYTFTFNLTKHNREEL